MARLFRVRIAGAGCRVQVSDGEGSQEELLGFFTTRDVVASTSDDAGRLAIESVTAELNELVCNGSHEPYTTEVQEVVELSGAQRLLGARARRGFTWFPDVRH